MSLKDEWQDTKHVFKQYKDNWRRESAQKYQLEERRFLFGYFLF